jgi:predicted nuclease of predicted toxin-antitoxin system
MRFLADESCDFAVVRALRASGHDVIAVSEACRGADDEVVARMAVETRRILITEDKDFGRLVHASSSERPGVLFIRFPGNARAVLSSTVVELVAQFGERLAGKFAVIRPSRIRIR